MATNPSILLQGQPVQNPLAQYSQVAALKNALGQGQLQQQQIQEGQQTLNGQRALDQAYQQAFTKDADGNTILNKDAVIQGLTSRHAGHLVPGVLKGFQEMDSAAADLKKKQAEAKTASDDYTANSLLTIADSKYDPSIAIGTIAHARETGAISPQQAVQLADQITANPTPQTVQAIIEPLLSRSPAYQKLVDSRKTAQAATDSAASRAQTATTAAAKQTIEAPGQKATADKAVLESELLKGATNGGAQNAIIDRFASKPEALKKALAAWQQNLPAGVAKATEEVNKIYDNEIGSAAKITSEAPARIAQEKALVPVKAAASAAEAAASEPIRARANADAQAYLMKQVGGPLQNIMDPGERARISGEYLKANDTYAAAAADAQKLKDYVAAARSGDQNAAALLPVVELRALVNRVNSRELQAAGGGSIIRTITNGIEKAGTGIPSEETLKEMEKAAALNEKSGSDAFAQKIRGIKAISPKANLSETPLAAAAPASGGWKVIGVK